MSAKVVAAFLRAAAHAVCEVGPVALLECSPQPITGDVSECGTSMIVREGGVRRKCTRVNVLQRTHEHMREPTVQSLQQRAQLLDRALQCDR